MTLHGVSATPSPEGTPVDSVPPGLDITLFWTLDIESWPEDLAISVRPTRNGAFIGHPDDLATILQQDLPKPAQGMLTRSSSANSRTVADAYRFVPAGDADGVMIIVYRPTNDGFENLAEINAPFTLDAE